MDREISHGSEVLQSARQPLILAVDDDLDSLALITYLLDGWGCDVITATQGSTAIALAESCEPDLILLDIALPDFDGIEVTRKLKHNKKTSRIPIIIVSALPKDQYEQITLSAGCQGYIFKPYHFEEIAIVISRYTQVKCLN